MRWILHINDGRLSHASEEVMKSEGKERKGCSKRCHVKNISIKVLTSRASKSQSPSTLRRHLTRRIRLDRTRGFNKIRV